jgi:hypothetical protein
VARPPTIAPPGLAIHRDEGHRRNRPKARIHGVSTMRA